jgi:hypothetical protein
LPKNTAGKSGEKSWYWQLPKTERKQLTYSDMEEFSRQTREKLKKLYR